MAGPSPTSREAVGVEGSVRKEPSYKETKGKEVGRVADETVVLMMDMEQNISGGKGLC